MNRFRGLAANINKATHDQRTKDLIEKTWLLQDRFDFGDQPEPLVLMRKLGHVMLCGVLHVAYQTRKEVKGQYMLCAQFRSCLILAVSEKTSPGYAVVACIPLNAIQLEEADNGRGKNVADMKIDSVLTELRLAMPHGTLLVENRLQHGASLL